MSCIKISDQSQTVRHFGLDCRESLENAVTPRVPRFVWKRYVIWSENNTQNYVIARAADGGGGGQGRQLAPGPHPQGGPI